MANHHEDQLRTMIRAAVRQALAEQTSLNPAPNSEPAIESSKPAPAEYFAPWTGVAYDAHPSQQKFNISEATVTLGDLLEFVEAKACTIEKNKPCDQCGMCRSLGF